MSEMSTTHGDDGSVDHGLVPNDPLTGHSYDGIQEFDNPLPGWWKWLFVGTIVFALPYLGYYHSGSGGRSLADGYESAMAANMELQFAELGEVTADGDGVLRFLNEPSWLAFGKSVYKTNCVSCHAGDGGGLVGPNLCDDNYKNIRELGDFITVLQKGAAGGAMPAWNNRLNTNEIVLVSAYVASLRGSEPAKPMAPAGDVIAPWPEPPEKSEADAAAE